MTHFQLFAWFGQTLLNSKKNGEKSKLWYISKICEKDAQLLSTHFFTNSRYGNMRILANNEQFVPYCVIHAASADGKFGKKSTTATVLTAEERLKQNEVRNW